MPFDDVDLADQPAGQLKSRKLVVSGVIGALVTVAVVISTALVLVIGSRRGDAPPPPASRTPATHVPTVPATPPPSAATRTATPPATAAASIAPPTPTPTERATPSSSCPGAPPQRVQVGGEALVCTSSDNLIRRAEPRRSGEALDYLEPGTALTITGGPECSDDWSWWRVVTDAGGEGWVTEGGDDEDAYYLCPVVPLPTPDCRPVTGTLGQVWSLVRDAVGCPVGPVTQDHVIEQPFEGGWMVWREATDGGRVLVLFRDGTWRTEAIPPGGESASGECSTASMAADCPPPADGRFERVWCGVPGLPQQLGQALACEREYDAPLLRFSDGAMLQNDEGIVYVTYSNGLWEPR